MNPGPVNVTSGVRRALLGPDICHREEEFSLLLSRVRSKILAIFKIQKTHTVAVISGSGTSALESMLSSYAQPSKKVLVLSNGVYGDRMKSILEVHGAAVDVLKAELGGFPSMQSIEKMLQNDPSISAIGLVHHETSTGMLNPLSEVSKLAKKYKKHLLVDAISSLGAEKIDLQKDSIDLCAATSGKCFHSFPGVSFVILKKSMVPVLKKIPRKTLYLDLLNTLEHEEKNDTPFTPAVQLFYALETALDELIRQGLEKRISEYEKKSQFLEKGFSGLGIGFVVEKKYRSHVLTALWTPSGVSYQTLHDRLKKAGFVIYAGQSQLQGKIFRVSNLGAMTLADLRRFLAELKKILRK